MSAPLLFLIPVGMLAVAWPLCFVGCVPPDKVYVPYSNTILAEPSLIAYWPLSDLRGPTMPLTGPLEGSFGVGTAADLSGNGHQGTYTIPPDYQTGATIPQIANPTTQAGTAQSGLNLHQTSIVPGDAAGIGSKNLPACVGFEGGYVNIA